MTSFGGSQLHLVSIRLSRLMTYSLKELKNRLLLQPPGSLGDRLNVSSSVGSCYKTKFGQLKGYYYVNGQTATFALCVSAIWRRPSIWWLSVPSPTLFGQPQLNGRAVPHWHRPLGLHIAICKSGSATSSRFTIIFEKELARWFY